MLVGVLGGMGPAATGDFMAKLTAMTEARCDQEHLPVIVLSDPRVPDRSAAICKTGPSPLPALASKLSALEAAGVTLIAIPCNTSHYWYDKLAECVSVPIVSIVEATVSEVARHARKGARIGVIATTGAIIGRVYQEPLARAGYEPVTLAAKTRERLVEGGIRAVKAGEIAEGRALLETALARFAQSGCEAVILGCTEASVALEGDAPELQARNPALKLIDSNRALAIAVLTRTGRGLADACALLPSPCPVDSCQPGAERRAC